MEESDIEFAFYLVCTTGTLLSGIMQYAAPGIGAMTLFAEWLICGPIFVYLEYTIPRNKLAKQQGEMKND